MRGKGDRKTGDTDVPEDARMLNPEEVAKKNRLAKKRAAPREDEEHKTSEPEGLQRPERNTFPKVLKIR